MKTKQNKTEPISGLPSPFNLLVCLDFVSSTQRAGPDVMVQVGKAKCSLFLKKKSGS